MKGDEKSAYAAPSGDGIADERVSLKAEADDPGDGSAHKVTTKFEFEKEIITDVNKEDETMSKGRRILNTANVYAAFFSIGLVYASIGPALIDLEDVFYTDTKTIVVAFSCMCAGYLLGALLAGYLIDKLRGPFFFFVATICMGIFLAASVWIRSLVAFCVFMTIMAYFQGSIDCGANVALLRLWNHSHHKNSLLQAMHFLWSVGATICPFIVEPFLSPDRNSGHSQDNSTSNVVGHLNYIANASVKEHVYDLDATNANNSDQELSTNVQFGIFAVGMVPVCLSVICFVAFVMDGWKVREAAHEKGKQAAKKTQTKLFKFLMIVGVVILYFFYICTEKATGNLIATFVVDGLKWEKFKGPLITSVFWGIFGLGRLSGIFLSRLLRPAYLMYLDATVVCVGFIILTAMIHVHETVTWACIALTGLGMGSMFPTGLSFVNEYLTLDGLISACVLGVTAVSSMIMVPLSGYIFATYGPLSMVYVLLTSSLSLLVVFIALHVFASRCSSTTMEMVTENEIDTGEDEFSSLRA